MISIHALLAESDWTGSDRGGPVPHFYPRSPCGERRRIFSPLMTIPKFLSTLSLRRATGQRLVVQPVANISIHALLAESDPSPRTPPASGQNFYPRSPCGERRESPDSNRHCENFYPRSPCGERRLAGLYTARRRAISIHALLAESDGFGGGYRLAGQISIHALLAESDDPSAKNYTPRLLFLSTLSLRRATAPATI